MRSMKTSTVVWIVVLVIIVIGGVWWWNVSSTPADTTTTTSSTTTPEGYTIGESNSPTFGEYLVTPSGMALYTYTSDTPGVSNCSASCATTWPPYSVTAGASLSGNSSVTGTVATITRSDGSAQVTYNGSPLYTYSGDTAVGQTNGEGMTGWTLATP
jgi:predicted lipoprotein with Yx(FWY)xxD motif